MINNINVETTHHTAVQGQF